MKRRKDGRIAWHEGDSETSFSRLVLFLPRFQQWSSLTCSTLGYSKCTSDPKRQIPGRAVCEVGEAG